MPPEINPTTGTEFCLSRILEIAVEAGFCILRFFRPLKFRTAVGAKPGIISVFNGTRIAFHSITFTRWLLLHPFFFS